MKTEFKKNINGQKESTGKIWMRNKQNNENIEYKKKKTKQKKRKKAKQNARKK